MSSFVVVRGVSRLYLAAVAMAFLFISWNTGSRPPVRAWYHLGQVLVRRVSHGAQRKDIARIKNQVLAVDRQRPEARQRGRVLLRRHLVRVPLHRVKPPSVARQHRQRRKSHQQVKH